MVLHGYPKLNPAAFTGFYGYPPHFAVLLSKLATWDLETAKKVWLNLCNFLYILGALMLISVLYKGKKVEVYFFLLSLALVSHGFISDAYLGQSNRLLFFLLSASVYLFYRKKAAWLAGIALRLPSFLN